MPTFVIYLEDNKHIDQTIDDLLDKTPKSLIDGIVVCDDNKVGYKRDDVTIIKTDKIGRACAWNNAARGIQKKQIIFLSQATKFSDKWLESIVEILNSNRTAIVTPIVHRLDTNLWTMDSKHTAKFGWRWDLKQYDKIAKSKYSPSASHFCLAVNKAHLTDLGGFDDNMKYGDGESLELSIRNWLFGGTVEVADSRIASFVSVNESLDNLGRIAEIWFPAFASHFYRARGIKPSDLNVGDLTNLTNLQEKQKITFDGYLSSQLPELLNIFDLFNSAYGKNIAVVADGPSIDKINPAAIYRNDIVISVDYMGLRFDSDYAMTSSAEVVTQLRRKYHDKKLVLPLVIESKSVGNLVNAVDVAADAFVFESCNANDLNFGIMPPFANFGSVVHNAVNFALFLGGSVVTLYGCDNKVIGGKSHSGIKYYNGGEIWPDTESIRSRFAGFEYGLDRLGRLAEDNNITLLRLNHA